MYQEAKMRVTAVTLLVLTLLLLPMSGGPALALGPDSDGTVHIVQWGDTLSSIASYYGTTVEAIMAANNLPNPDYIYVGQRLLIPGGSPMPPGPGSTYVVQWGDTLYSIARRFGTTVEALVLANGLPNAWQIFAGQELLIPGPGAGPVPPHPVPTAAVTHVVRPGETLSSIAYHYATTVNAIAQANNLYNPSYIYVGQRLIIPSGVATPFGPPTMTYYTVMPGDTCAAIALRYGLTPWAIAMANNLPNPALIYPGQQLAIPCGPAVGVVPPKPRAGGVVPSPVLCSGPNPPPECSSLAAPPGLAMPPATPIVPPQNSTANKTPMQTREWTGVIVKNTSGVTDTMRFSSVLRVVVGAAKGLPVTVTDVTHGDGQHLVARGLTGTKPEYGEGAVEFAPFRYGTYRVTPEGLGTSIDVELDGEGEAFVQFYQTDTGRPIPPVMPAVPRAQF
jgi:LysM repeat protein